MNKTTMIITLDAVADFVGVIFDDPSDDREDHPGEHESCMLKEDFFRFYKLDTSNVVSAFYEPREGVFMVQYDNGEAEAFDSPQDHPVLQAMDNLAEIILSDELIIKNNLYPGISHREDGGWLDTLDKLAVQMGTDRFMSLDDIPDSVWKDPTYKTLLEDKGITEDLKGMV